MVPTAPPSAKAVLTLPPAPQASLGPEVWAWCQTYIRQPDGPDAGESWRFTREQVRFLHYFYAVDGRGRFLWSRAVLRRAKGWGKSPFMAALALAELCGPVRFGGWDAEGDPVGKPVPMPWVQLAGVSEKQTVNTMSMVLAMLAESPAVDDYGLDPGLTRVFANGGGRLEPITASAPSAEGARPTFCALDETHHWMRANGGHKLAEVIRRNLGKSRDGMARSIETTNAHEMGMESVAERSYDAWQSQHTGRSKGSTILYDSREAPPGVDMGDDEVLLPALMATYGDSTWVDLERVADEVNDPGTPPAEARRFYLNQLAVSEEAWVDPGKFDARACPDRLVADQDEVALFFDGSKSDDATGLVGCRMSDGHVFTVGMWQKPPGDRGRDWVVPRYEVDVAVRATFDRFRPVAFYADPSHVKDDVTQEAFWDALIDEWHRSFKDQLRVWAKPGPAGHAVMWDMASPARAEAFTQAAMRCAADIEQPDGDLTWDGDGRLRGHVHNAQRAGNAWGVSMRKNGGRESQRKIDLAVCMVGARMARRDVLNRAKPTRERSGKVY